MPIFSKLGFFSGEKSTLPGAAEAVIKTFRGESKGSQARIGGARSFDFYNRHPAPPPPGYERVFISSYTDIRSFIRPGLADYSDIDADISMIQLPLKNLYALISGWGSSSIGIYSNISARHVGIVDILYSWVVGWKSTSTQPLSYDNTIVATPSGLSIIKRQLTKFPDITAVIGGWDYSNVGADIYIGQRAYKDLGAYVGTIGVSYSDLSALITTMYIEDLPTCIFSIPPNNLYCSLFSIPPSNISGFIAPVPPSDLLVFAGGHPPEDILANLLVNLPVPISAWIRSGNSYISNITASISGSGGFKDLGSWVRVVNGDSSFIKASVIVREPVNLYGWISGWKELELTANIKGVHSSVLQAILYGVAVEEHKDLKVFIRPSWEGSSNLGTGIYGWISAHTTDKPINFNLLSRPFNSFILSHRKGITKLTLEPVRGVFPDLHAQILCIPCYTSDLRTFIRATIGLSSNLGASLNAVTKTIYITKIPINFVNLSDIYATITAFSGYKKLYASIRGYVSARTDTSSGSGWVYSSSSVKFYIGTNKGLFIPTGVKRSIRTVGFINNSNFPDLRSYIFGWGVGGLTASISVQPYSSLLSYITGQDLSHIKDVSATIVSMYTDDLVSFIVGIGGFYSMPASISSSGDTLGIGASIKPYLKVSGFRIIPVETRPFIDLRSYINPISSCGHYSSYSPISAFIRPAKIFSGGDPMYASINSLSNISDLFVSINCKKITRIRLLDIMFRTLRRASSTISSYIVGIDSSYKDLISSIGSIPHEVALYASITPYIAGFSSMPKQELINVYKVIGMNAELYKQLKMTFASKPEKLIYDGIEKAIYSIGNKKWVLNISEVSETGTFFDKKTTDRNKLIDSIEEYDSVDEAVRAAIDILAEMRKVDVSASITAIGGYNGLRAYIYGDALDRVSNLPTSIYIVNNEPVLYATISAYSGYLGLKSLVIGWDSKSPDIKASISGVVYDSIFAEINSVI